MNEEQVLRLQLDPRRLLLMREEVERAILSLPEQEARAAALALVDDWAGRVMKAHIGSEDFGLWSRVEFHVARTTPWFGGLAAGPSGPPWAFQVECLMRKRLEFWDERSSRFPVRPQVKAALNFGTGIP